MKENVIEIKNLNKSYGKKLILDQVNMTVKRSSICGLVGENGSGKTTILKSILGIINPDSGSIRILSEEDKEGLERARSNIGSLVESPKFYGYMTAWENLNYYAIQRGINDKNLIDRLLKDMNLDKLSNKRYKDFSLGMKQRLGIALALMSDPDILILDEPINGLDPEGILELRSLLLKLNKEKGVTIIISSHILEELSYIASDYAFIKNGRIIREVSSKELEEYSRRSIIVRVDNIDRASVILEKELKSLEYKVVDDERIAIYDFLDRPEEISKCLVNNDIGIKSMEEQTDNLEDYYMKILGGGLND